MMQKGGGLMNTDDKDVYADLKQRGELIGDADILITASALIDGLTVVTNNEEHFKRVSELHGEN